MAKDPAFLFYTGDFSTGTQFFTDEQVGKYLRLLMAQHQLGHLEEKHMIIICKSYDKDIFSKFEKDKDGLFYNEKLELIINQRRAYSESRSKNKLGKTKPEIISLSYDNHMEDENENKDIIKNKGGEKKKFIPPTLEEVKTFFSENGYNNAEKVWNYYNDGDWKDAHGTQVLSWKQKIRGNWFKDENKVPETQLRNTVG